MMAREAVSGKNRLEKMNNIFKGGESAVVEKGVRIYVTHCSARENDTYKNKGIKVTPIELYILPRIQSFMKRCMDRQVKWAIFSDKYGVVFSNEKIEWYEMPPDLVLKDPAHFKWLVNNFDTKLANFDEIWFYYNPARFHRVYKKLIEHSSLKKKIKLFSTIKEIK